MISVAIASFNGGARLLRQLESIFCQTRQVDEIIISEAGDVDYLDSLLAALPLAPTVKVVRFRPAQRTVDVMGRVSLNFFNAISFCRGEYIFLSDQDDVWLPDKVERFCDALSGSDLIVGDCSVFSSDGSPISSSYFRSSFCKNNLFLQLLRPRVLGSCMAFRKGLLDSFLIPELSFSFPHDLFFYIFFKMYGRVTFLEGSSMKYIRYDNSLSLGKNHIFSVFRNRFRYVLIYLTAIFLRRRPK